MKEIAWKRDRYGNIIKFYKVSDRRPHFVISSQPNLTLKGYRVAWGEWDKVGHYPDKKEA
jgi:hypothetical protein